MSTETEKSPLQAQLEEWARAATPEELQEQAGGEGTPADVAREEIARRVEEAENRKLLPAEFTNLPVEALQVLVDAIRLRQIALELYGEADLHMRAKQPRFRRADSVIQDTSYLVGGDSICTGNINCGCPAHEAYNEWMHRDAEEREQAEAEERAAGGGRLE